MTEVEKWLSAGAGAQEGLRLLRKYAPNAALERMVSAHPEYAHLLKRALARFTSVEPAAAAPAPPERERRLLRQDYPFLSREDCPDELKIIAADKITAWHNFASSHEELFSCTSPEECLAVAKNVIKFYYQNSVFRAELEYYREHGVILGKAPIFRRHQEEKKIRGLTLGELIQRRNTLRNGIWKLEAKLRDGCRPDLDDSRQSLLEEKRRQLALVEKTLSEYELWKKKSK